MSHGTRISTDRLLADLWRVSEELGRPPTAHEYDDRGRYSRSPLRRRFGGWNAALEAADIGVQKEYDIDRHRLVADLLHVAEELDETPTRRQYREHGRYSDSAQQDHFGSWKNAIHAAGLEVKGVGDVTDSESAATYFLRRNVAGVPDGGGRA